MCSLSMSILFPVPLNKGNMGYKDSGFQEKKNDFHIAFCMSFLSFPTSMVLSAFYPQHVFCSQSAVCILHPVCMLPLIH